MAESSSESATTDHSRSVHDDKSVEAPAPRVGHHPIQLRPAILRARDAHVHVLVGYGQASATGVLSERDQLIPGSARTSSAFSFWSKNGPRIGRDRNSDDKEARHHLFPTLISPTNLGLGVGVIPVVR